ncbi:MAG: protein kinase domain-containing protein, partial [Myxococcota bacterium]
MRQSIEPGRLVGDRYAVDRCLPSLPFGLAAIARNQEGAEVLLRLFPEATDLNRFFDTLASCNVPSPGVIPVIDHGTDATTGLPFLVSPLARGRSLDELLGNHGPMEPATVVRTGIDLANALSDAHGRDVRHGALTPRDIVLEQQADLVTVRVGGFGLRQALGAAGHKSAQFVTDRDAYTAPENVDHTFYATAAADLWSVGVILYQCLTTERPFDEPKDWDELRAALALDLVP